MTGFWYSFNKIHLIEQQWNTHPLCQILLISISKSKQKKPLIFCCKHLLSVLTSTSVSFFTFYLLKETDHNIRLLVLCADINHLNGAGLLWAALKGAPPSACPQAIKHLTTSPACAQLCFIPILSHKAKTKVLLVTGCNDKLQKLQKLIIALEITSVLVVFLSTLSEMYLS